MSIVLEQDGSHGVALHDAGEGQQFTGPGLGAGALRSGRYWVQSPMTPYAQPQLWGTYTDDLERAQNAYRVEVARCKAQKEAREYVARHYPRKPRN
ncbi:hypothetical protein ACLB5K_004695 [Enterobacter hormaechei]|uniref:Uncharacterized protein n=1 Tax=Enterobacter hormaechei TaxID=158836 RepID=A0ABD4K3L7_9ENTR|nr:hypothetical protein [Enterobacter hormaechei]CAF9476265.1 hypothetical protein AI2905V1_4762 [Enterobacter cloacae]HBM2852090.1 hypothetical protein [Enterobacter hormaechei subsp. xiangfangensis]EKV9066899.1 hypothetical protein [Enterobacter hormaechei]ELC6327051.1 hypothetical protein [Enterobacter hormaechei]ELC6592081.1 hypothetical protein [Enterobacter hormaechei]